MKTLLVSLEIDGEIVIDGSAEMGVERLQRTMLDWLGDEYEVESADITLTGEGPHVDVERRIRIVGPDE